MSRDPVYHEGERTIQDACGTRELADKLAGLVKAAVDPRAREFLEQQRWIVVGSTDATGQPWASMLFGPAGFVATADGRNVALELASASHSPKDPLWSNLKLGDDLGLLAIDFDTRRRLRINGTIEANAVGQALLRVRESYPNCAKYIHRRRLLSLMLTAPDDRGLESDGPLAEAQLEWIAGSTVFFMATRHPRRGLDVSHRGGLPGFVHVTPGRLSVPDYTGNGMFNTLGNLQVDDRAGLLFVDFIRGSALQVAGRVVVRDEQAASTTHPSQTRRFWELLVTSFRELPLGVAYHWESLEPSPHSPGDQLPR